MFEEVHRGLKLRTDTGAGLIGALPGPFEVGLQFVDAVLKGLLLFADFVDPFASVFSVDIDLAQESEDRPGTLGDLLRTTSNSSRSAISARSCSIVSSFSASRSRSSSFSVRSSSTSAWRSSFRARSFPYP